MNKYEEKAREIHKQGNTCSKAMHTAFSEDYNLSEDYPLPRSVDGKCGALLTALKILKEKGLEDKVEEFENEFIKRFKYTKCLDLLKHDRRCNDYVGESAKLLDEILTKNNKK